MKMTIEVECTPVEARQFLGLPDVTVLNDALIDEMTKRMQSNMAMMAPEAMMKSWMTAGTAMQENFMKLMTAGASAAAARKPE
jgi:hypothetical protein